VDERPLGPRAGESKGIAFCADAIRGGGTRMTRFRKIIAIMVATLREIFDESAYGRFLAYHQIGSCPSAYAAFLREQENIKSRRPKCC
jgi:hypothetical protein